MTKEQVDVVVIGGGPGGYVTAIRASQLGLKTTVIEKAHLGGICLNWGCIPTKALLRSAEVYHLLKRADEFGISVKDVSFDIKKIVERSRGVANKLSSGISHLLKKNKVTHVVGHAALQGKQVVKVVKEDKSEQLIHARYIILATGAHPRQLPGLETDGKLIWNYRDAMIPDHIPKRLLIVGSGAIGIEFASFYNSFGSKVTVVEVMDHILPAEDGEISDFAKKAFEKQGIEIITGTTVKAFKKSTKDVTATIDHKASQSERVFDRVIMAVGIDGNVDGIGLENTKVKVERGHIVTDEWSQTAEPFVYAIGDVAGPPWLAHKASHEGILCIERITQQPDIHPLNKDLIPGCTYSFPQVASVGLTEKEAIAKGYAITIGRFPFAGNGKAIALGEVEGMVKTIFDKKTGELLGAHMVGAEVTELIQGYGIAKTLEATELELMHTVFPHPTLSEMMHESVLDAFGKVIHF